MCCGAGMEATMKAVRFSQFGGPEVLEIAIEGRRRPKVAAYWDGCLMAMAG